MRADIFTGCLWGCAVGNAIGLPYEGLSTRRVRRFASLPLEHRFDTVAAIAGALAGISTGPDSVPVSWRTGVVDWPHSLGYLHRLAAALADPAAPVNTAFSPWLFVRGVVFIALVLTPMDFADCSRPIDPR